MFLCDSVTLKVLLAGFGPFLSYTTNPAAYVAKALNGKKIGDADIMGRVLPVDHRVSAMQVHEYMVTEKPDIVIGLGLYATRGCISLENIATNNYYFQSKEEEWNERIYEDGKEAYFSTLPLNDIKNLLQIKGIPAEHSFSADTWVSNEVFYEIMRSAEKLNIQKAGFVHLPLTHQQVIDLKHIHNITRLGIPSMSDEMLVEAVRLTVEETLKE